MTMTVWQSILMIAAVALGTILTRFLPFWLFPSGKEPSPYIRYLGAVLPYASMALLVVYSLKNVSLAGGSHGIPEGLGVLAVALLHRWKKNTLLSILGGTAVYMLLVQFLFLPAA